MLVALDCPEPFEPVPITSTLTAPRAVVWHCSEPAVVLGASQRQLASEVRGLRVSCRRSGGGAVLVGPWLVSVSVLVPAGDPLARLGIAASARWLGAIHVDALERLGISSAAADESGPQIVPWACFGSVTRGELVAGVGRKLTGIAQERRRHGVHLVAGTLVTPPDWGLLCRSLQAGPRDPELLADVTTSCARVVGRPVDTASVASSLAASLAAALGAG